MVDKYDLPFDSEQFADYRIAILIGSQNCFAQIKIHDSSLSPCSV